MASSWRFFLATAKDQTYRRAFLSILVIVVTIAFVAVMRSFLITLLLAAIFTALLHPFYRSLLQLFRGRQTLASLVTLLLTILVVVLPMILFLGVLVAQALDVSQRAVPWIQDQLSNPSELMRRLESVPGFEDLQPYRQQILTRLGELVGLIGTFTVNLITSATKGTFAFALQLVILVYAMFFFLMSGGKALAQIFDHVPLSRAESKQIVSRFVVVTRAALMSTFVVGVIQGALGGIAFWVAGIQGAVFWGTLMFVFSMIPGIGTALVWLPASIYLITTGRIAAGLLLFAFCGLIVGSVDNVLRPRLVGKDTKLHDLVVLLSTLGGIMLLGAIGFIIGPIVAALFITVWDIYAQFMRGSAGMEKISTLESKGPSS
jgi:predicted PurR-regulated permease PerM